MAEKSLTFHVPPDASLVNLLSFGDGLQRQGNPLRDSTADLLALACEVYELPQRSEVTNFAQRLGLLPDAAPWRLTARALGILSCQPAIQRDMLHYLAYACWDSASPTRNVPLWSYRYTVTLLWNRGSMHVKDAGALLVEEIVGASRDYFSDVVGYNPEKVSYSTKSVRGVFHWLRALQPPVVVGDIFSRRQTCSAQLIVLAIGDAARQAGIAPGHDVLLSQDRREAICRVCLLDPGYLDRLLDWTLPQYPRFLAPGMRGGSYGRSIRLLRSPTVELVCPAPEQGV